MKASHILLLLCLTLPGVAKDATVGGRIRFSYDDTRWELQPNALRGADLMRLADDEGDFTALVMPEKTIADGMTSAESRRKFIEGLARTRAKTEDVKPIAIFEKNGYEFTGKRELNGTNLHMRIILIVDDGDVLIVVSSAPERDPMSADSIAKVWKSVAVLKKA
jgi:hypothetical protein